MISPFTYFPGAGRGFQRLVSNCWLLCLFLLSLASVGHAEPSAANNAEVEMGRKIYMEGMRPSGESLKGMRQSSVQVEGATAACETCHRRSGMGSLEGNIVVMPITGRFLFATAENRPLALVDPREAKNVTRAHAPYNDESLGKAIREGINVSGAKMSPLMPQYALTDVEIKAVSSYLKQLSSDLSPGVGESSLRFATIVTPGVDPQKSKVMEDMMRRAFEQRNASQQTYSGRMRSPLDLLPRTLRNWDLTVWVLEGAPETWAAQLAEKYRSEPVFAVISGVSTTTWAPVHNFCQQEKLPCMFPSVALPPVETGYYPLYFSRGVTLEAEVLAKHLRSEDKSVPKRLVQFYRDDEVGRGAAKALTDALKDFDIKIENRALDDKDLAHLKNTLKDISSKDAVMLWLQSADLTAVSKAAPKQVPAVAYVSGFLAAENYSFISKAWKPNVRVVYPYELGAKREKNQQMMKGWLKTWQLPLVDEAFQSEVFFNVLFLTDLSSQMLDNLFRDHLIERAEDMLSFGSNVSAYPFLGLSRGQRFASKGAYIARFGKDGKLGADSEWLVP